MFVGARTQFQGGSSRARLGASWLIGAALSGCTAPALEQSWDEPSRDDSSSLVFAQDASSTQEVFGSEGNGDSVRPWCHTLKDPAGAWGRLPLARDELRGVSIYQGVEIELPLHGGVHRTDVIAGRQALLRVFVQPQDETHGVRLLVQNERSKTLVLEDERVMTGASSKSDLLTTYNFIIPDGAIAPETRIAIELYEYGPCAEAEAPKERASFPAEGSYPLYAREVGALQVVLVPVRYDSDGSGRMPDVSEEHLTLLREHLHALYPVRDTVLRVREPIATMETSMEGILGQMLHLRSLEQAERNVAYFGLVNPAATMDEYCSVTCVAGVSAVGSPSGEASAGVGIGFRGPAQETFLHELGHMNRLEHAPCGAPISPDVRYPYPDATLGSWGYDLRDRRLIDPGGGARDFMSYCDPAWISDYNFGKLIHHLSLVNALPNADQVTWPKRADGADEGEVERSRFSASDPRAPLGEPSEFMMAFLSPGTAPRLTAGLPERPLGAATRGIWLDEYGGAIGVVGVTELEVSEGRGKFVYFPTPHAGQRALRLSDGSTISFETAG